MKVCDLCRADARHSMVLDGIQTFDLCEAHYQDIQIALGLQTGAPILEIKPSNNPTTKNSAPLTKPKKGT